MAIADLLSDIGKGVKTGARALGAVAQPIAERTAQVVSGEAPQIDEEQRQRQTQLEDQQIAAKSQQLEQGLAIGQKYGTLTPQQQQEYVDQISQLYSHPRHAGTLMEKLRKAIHPNGAYAQGPQAPLANPTPQGGTLAADEQAKEDAALAGEDAKAAAARQQAISTADFLTSQLPPGTPDADKIAFRNNALDHLLKASTGREPAPKGMKAIPGGAGIIDQDTGKQYLPEQLAPGGDAPPQAKSMWAAIQKAEKDKADAAQKKIDDANTEREKIAKMSEGASASRQATSEQNQAAMADYREKLSIAKPLTTEADDLERQKKTIDAGLSVPGNKSAVDNALIYAYTRVQAKGGRMTTAEIQLTQKIGSLGLTVEQMYQKAATGELPVPLRKMLYDVVRTGAQESRKEAQSAQADADASRPQVGTGAKRVGDLLSKPITQSTKKRVSLAKAKQLPQFQGKSDDEIRQAATALGYEVY